MFHYFDAWYLNCNISTLSPPISCCGNVANSLGSLRDMYLIASEWTQLSIPEELHFFNITQHHLLMLMDYFSDRLFLGNKAWNISIGNLFPQKCAKAHYFSSLPLLSTSQPRENEVLELNPGTIMILNFVFQDCPTISPYT